MKVLFYDKHIKFNNPYYAINLLEDLRLKGYEILVMVGDSHNIRGSPIILENLLGLNFKDIYSNFDFEFINDINDASKVIDDFSPDIFLSDFCLNNFELEILKLIKFKKIRDVGMDMVSSEILLYSRNHRAPIHLVHQIKGYFERFNFYSKRFLNRNLFSIGSESLSRIPISNIITIKGLFFRNKLSKYNLSRFPVTGSIQFDQLTNNKNSTEVLDKLSINSDIPIVILAPSTKEEESLDSNFIRSACENIANNSNFQLFINPHPSDRLFYPNRFDNLPGKILSSIDFYKLLPHANCLITPVSTVGLEAAYCQVPVLGSDIYKELNWEFPYFRDGFNVGQKVNENNIVDIINRIVDKKVIFNFDRFIEYMCYKDDGLSYKRVSMVVDRYVSNKKGDIS